MLSEYQKQLNRVHFFSNKVVSVGKVDYKFKLKPMSTLITKLKKQVEENVSKEIEEELSQEQIEIRLRIFLPAEFKNIDLTTTTFKQFYKILTDNNIVTTADINKNKEFIKKIIEEEIEKFNIKKDIEAKEEAIKELEAIKAKEEAKEEAKEKKTQQQLYRSSDPVRNLITKILSEKGYYKDTNIEENEDEEEEDSEKVKRIGSADLEKLFKESNVNSTVDKVADYIYDLFEDCKIPSKYYNLSLTSSRFIADLMQKEYNINISPYIIQLFLGKYCRLYDLKNIMLKNKKRIQERCKVKGIDI